MHHFQGATDCPCLAQGYRCAQPLARFSPPFRMPVRLVCASPAGLVSNPLTLCCRGTDCPANERPSASVKSFAPCCICAVVTEALIYRTATREYSPVIDALLVAAWGLGSLVLAWFEPRRRFVYLGSVALSAPCISYSMLGYGLLEMGGFVHALCAGVYALPFHYVFQCLRKRRHQPCICTSGF